MIMSFLKPQGVWTSQGATWANEPDTPWWLRPRKSQCEDWYQVTPWIGEFWCTVTNLPFLYVAWIYSFWPLALVGATSLIHHAIPYQWIVECDKAFAFAMIGWVTWKVFTLALWSLLWPLLGCAFLMVADGASIGSWTRAWIHPVWHCGCAAFMYLFLDLDV